VAETKSIGNALTLFSKAENAYDDNRRADWLRLKDAAREALESCGFTKVGAGAYRFVYAYPSKNRVLKISKSQMGRKQNKSAIGLWKEAAASTRKHLARCFDYSTDNRLMVQERVNDTCTESDVHTVKKSLQKNNINVDEINIFNVGVRSDGTPVLYDYGGGCEMQHDRGAAGCFINRTIFLSLWSEIRPFLPNI
jgi:hypothetical protein